MTKLFYTYNLLLKHNACEDGLKAVLAAHPDLIEHPDREINILDLLETNSVSHCIWALRATTTDSREVSVEIAKRAAKRAKEYNAEYDDSDYADYITDAAISYADEAIEATNATDAAVYAADSTSCAIDADILDAFYEEREKQKSDLLELLDY